MYRQNSLYEFAQDEYVKTRHERISDALEDFVCKPVVFKTIGFIGTWVILLYAIGGTLIVPLWVVDNYITVVPLNVPNQQWLLIDLVISFWAALLFKIRDWIRESQARKQLEKNDTIEENPLLILANLAERNLKVRDPQGYAKFMELIQSKNEERKKKEKIEEKAMADAFNRIMDLEKLNHVMRKDISRLVEKIENIKKNPADSKSD